MAGLIKKTVAKVKNNPLITIGAGVGAFYLSKKYNITNKYALIGLTVLGGITGAFVSSHVKSYQTQPKVKDIK